MCVLRVLSVSLGVEEGDLLGVLGRGPRGAGTVSPAGLCPAPDEALGSLLLLPISVTAFNKLSPSPWLEPPILGVPIANTVGVACGVRSSAAHLSINWSAVIFWGSDITLEKARDAPDT